MNNIIRWAICDDADYLCRNFQLDLSVFDNFKFEGKANNTTECLELVKNIEPDILLLDIQMQEERTGIDINKIFIRKKTSKIIAVILNIDFLPDFISTNSFLL